MPLAASIDLPDRYRVVRHIASGGMASVWEVEDTLLGRLVAVKVLGAQFAADPSARARFQREARTAAQVSDQTHVVTIYDIGEHADDAYIVMEHFAGGTVADRLRAARDAGERIPRETALRWLREAATGLDVAHAAGIVHRDVKPANLLLDAQDRLAVGDFGIARLADDTQMTQTGQVLGTAAYISPEQALGRPATEASDRYALAVVAYELLTGARPFAGGSAPVQARQHAEVQPEPASRAAPGLPPALDDFLARGLAKDPDRRPRTATELVTGIEAALAAGAGPPIEATRPLEPVVPTQPTGRLRQPVGSATHRPASASDPPRRRRPFPALLGAGLVVAAVIALVLVLAGSRDDSPETTAKQRTTAKAAARTTSTPAAAPQPPAAAKEAGSGAQTPDALQNRAFALVKQGRYGEAVAPARAAVQGYKDAGETGLPYAYALFNLAVALNRSGNPQEAIPLLRERLTYDDQRKTVQAELDDALAKTGEAAPADGGVAGNGKGKATNKGDRDDR